MSAAVSGWADRLRTAAARVPEPRMAHRVLRRLTHPLLPDDYSSLVHPLWSSRELRGQVVSVRRESDDAVTLVITPGWGATPDYRAGQYLGIGVLLDGKWTWRSYSLTADPASVDGQYSITVMAVAEGRLSNHIVGSVEPGTVVRLQAPAGDFHLPARLPSSILFLTAGSGITPVMGMLRSLDRRPDSGGFPDVHHVHSVRHESDALFLPELRALAERREGYTFELRETSSQGRIEPRRLEQTVPDWRERHTWACGPSALLDELGEVYSEAGLADRLHVEKFTIDRAVGAEGGRVEFGSEDRVAEADGATTLLEAGEEIGVRMPFGCRMGICQTCVVELEEGWVRDLRNGGDHGPGERIQTCVSVACGDVRLRM